MKNHTNRGFTLIDLVLILFIVGTFILVLPRFLPTRQKVTRINCTSNLKQVGLAFRLWEGDNNDKYPQAYAGDTNYPGINNPTPNDTGTKGSPWPESGNACPNLFSVFMVMSNELSNPRIVVCPVDVERWSQPPTNFTIDIASNKNSKISYFVGRNASDSSPSTILAGDRNISADTTDTKAPYGYSPVEKGISPGFVKSMGTNPAAAPLNGPNFGWTSKIHKGRGNVALVDGSVQSYDSIQLRAALQNSGDTNIAQNVLLFP